MVIEPGIWLIFHECVWCMVCWSSVSHTLFLFPLLYQSLFYRVLSVPENPLVSNQPRSMFLVYFYTKNHTMQRRKTCHVRIFLPASMRCLCFIVVTVGSVAVLLQADESWETSIGPMHSNLVAQNVIMLFIGICGIEQHLLLEWPAKSLSTHLVGAWTVAVSPSPVVVLLYLA